MAIHEIKPVLRRDKSIYVGFSILELRKKMNVWISLQIHKGKYNASLLFTDTDSLVYEIKTCLWRYFYRDKSLFDYSDSPQDKKFFNLVKKKVVGKVKDEFKRKIISEFIGL